MVTKNKTNEALQAELKRMIKKNVDLAKDNEILAQELKETRKENEDLRQGKASAVQEKNEYADRLDDYDALIGELRDLARATRKGAALIEVLAKLAEDKTEDR